MGIFDEEHQLSQTRDAKVAGIQAIAAILLLVMLPQVWQGIYPIRAIFGEMLGPDDLQVINLLGAAVPAVVAFLSWRRRAAAPAWVGMLAGGTLMAALIVIAFSLLGLVLSTTLG